MKVGDLVTYRKWPENYARHFGIVIGWNNYNRGVIPLVHWLTRRGEAILVRQRKLEVINESR